jgi:hypothetical protein
VRFHVLSGLPEQVEECVEVFGEDVDPRLANFPGLVIAATFRKDDVVISVGRLLDLGGVGARADGLEKVLEENGVIDFLCMASLVVPRG